MTETQLPIDVLHWLLALLPLVVLLYFLIGRSWKATEAGAVGMFAAAAIAIFVFQVSAKGLAVASGKGVWDAVFILYVVWPALLLYIIADRAGAFDALRKGIERFSSNELFLILAFGWIFSSFLQSIAGFGVPIAVVAPLLVALGVRPVYAVVIPLIGHAWANVFGTLAIAWLTNLQVINLKHVTETAFQTAMLLWLQDITAGFTIAWFYGRMEAVKHSWPMVVIISLIHGGGQLLLVLWDPVLACFIAASVAMIALFPLSKWKRYDKPAENIKERPIMSEKQKEEGQKQEKEEGEPIMGLWMASLPYVILTVVAIIGLVVAQDFLSQFKIGVPFSSVETGFGVTREAKQPYSPFAPLAHPGTYLLISALAAWLVYKSKGYYKEWAERGKKKTGIWDGLLKNAVPSSIAIVAFLVMSKVMDHSGQTEVLALGIAQVSSSAVFAFASNWIGVLGAFMTSSTTASNILFTSLQQQVVQAGQGLSESTIVASHNAGGAVGNAIAPANVVLGTGPTGILGEEGEVLRKALPWTIALAVLTGGATILLNGMTFIAGG